MGLKFIFILCLLLAVITSSCSSGDEQAVSPYFFEPYVPDILPNVTHQSEISWFENIAGNDGSITIYNELTGVTTGAEIISKTDCYSVIWFVILIPVEEFCLTDYSYTVSIPLDIGINHITLTATDPGGYVSIEKTYSIERVNYSPVSDNEPNDSIELAENVTAPTTIFDDGTNDSSIDYFLLTAEESREYTMIITSEHNYVAVSVYNLSQVNVADSDDTFPSGKYINGGYVNLWLNSGEQVFVLPYAYGEYTLGIY
jgi:hypothetical protein